MVGNVPNTAYFMDASFVKTQHKVAVSQNNIYYVRFLAEYGTDEAAMKALFYLDYLFERGKVKNADGSIDVAYWGGVIEGTDNYNHHHPNKMSGKEFAIKNASGVVTKIIILNEPLNTKGHLVGIGAATNREFHNVQIPITYKSAYYVPTTISGWEFRMWNTTLNNWDGWGDGGNLGAKPQNQQYTLSATVVFDDVSTALKQHGFQVRGYIQNAEGRYYGLSTLTVFVTGILTGIKEGSWSAGTLTNYYRDNVVIKGFEDPREQVLCRFYTNEGMTTLFQPAGIFTYWRDANNWLTYGYSELAGEYCVIRTGTASGSGTTVKPNTYVYEGYHATDMSNAENQVLNNTGSNMGTLYVDGFNAYISYSGSYPAWNWGTKAPQGYYADGNIASVNSVIYVAADGSYEYVYIN